MNSSTNDPELTNDDKLQDNLRIAIRLIQVAHDLADVYVAVRLVVDLPDVASKADMRQHLARLAASFLTKDFGAELRDYKAAFIVELAEKISELPDEEFV